MADVVAQTVLLVTFVEDERELYGAVLRAEGFRVVCPDGPEAAFAAALLEQPVAVITRIIQPGHDATGIDLLRRLKQHDTTSHIPVVIITSLSPDMYRAQAHHAGCDAFMLLPALPETVVLEVQRVVRERRHIV